MSVKNDPRLYREMSQPFADDEAANESLRGFFADIEASRKKHRIADVCVIVEVFMLRGDEEHRGGASLYLGASEHKLPMLAREYGAARAEYEEGLGSLIAQSRRKR